jgi:hypothetical protein
LRHLRKSYIIKSVVVSLLVAAGIAFYILLVKGRHYEVAAVIEWIIAGGFTLYLLTFWYDLRQSKGVKRGYFMNTNPSHPPDSARSIASSSHTQLRPTSQVPPMAQTRHGIRPISRGDSSFESPQSMMEVYYANGSTPSGSRFAPHTTERANSEGQQSESSGSVYPPSRASLQPNVNRV